MTQETIDNIFGFGFDKFSGEIIVSLFVMFVICIFSFVVYFKFKNADPTKPSKGFVLIIETIIEKLENFTVELMGERRREFSGYVAAVGLYIIMCFLMSLIGLPGPLTYLGCTFSIALCTFGLIHFTAMKTNKWGYFKRFVDPIPQLAPIFVPINLLSMWAPLLSLALRLFGNALAGFTLMGIIYYYLGQLSGVLFSGLLSFNVGSLFLPPLVTPILHLYFDVFSGAIQTLIFCMLTMIFISQEDPEEEEIQKQVCIER